MIKLRFYTFIMHFFFVSSKQINQWFTVWIFVLCSMPFSYMLFSFLREIHGNISSQSKKKSSHKRDFHKFNTKKCPRLRHLFSHEYINHRIRTMSCIFTFTFASAFLLHFFSIYCMLSHVNFNCAKESSHMSATNDQNESFSLHTLTIKLRHAQHLWR